MSAALAAALCGAPSAAAACETPAGARVVAESEEAVVTLESHGEDSDPLEGGTTERIYRGCAAANGGQVELHRGVGSFGSYSSAQTFRLAGPFVAFVIIEGTRYDSTERLATVDLRDGARWESAPITLAFTQVAVNRRGGSAWVRQTYNRRGRARWRLFVRHEGRITPVDTASRPLTRLKLSTKRLTWRDGRRARSRAL